MVLQSKMENYDYMNWISYKQTPDRNFEIETAGLPKKLELKKWTLLSPFRLADTFSLLVLVCLTQALSLLNKKRRQCIQCIMKTITLVLPPAVFPLS